MRDESFLFAFTWSNSIMSRREKSPQGAVCVCVGGAHFFLKPGDVRKDPGRAGSGGKKVPGAGWFKVAMASHCCEIQPRTPHSGLCGDPPHGHCLHPPSPSLAAPILSSCGLNTLTRGVASSLSGKTGASDGWLPPDQTRLSPAAEGAWRQGNRGRGQAWTPGPPCSEWKGGVQGDGVRAQCVGKGQEWSRTQANTEDSRSQAQEQRRDELIPSPQGAAPRDCARAGGAAWGGAGTAVPLRIQEWKYQSSQARAIMKWGTSIPRTPQGPPESHQK